MERDDDVRSPVSRLSCRPPWFTTAFVALDEPTPISITKTARIRLRPMVGNLYRMRAEGARSRPPLRRKRPMKIWNKPQVREQEVGLEVTSYMPAEIDII